MRSRCEGETDLVVFQTVSVKFIYILLLKSKVALFNAVGGRKTPKLEFQSVTFVTKRNPFHADIIVSVDFPS